MFQEWRQGDVTMEDLHKKLIMDRKIPLALYRNARHEHCSCERVQVEADIQQSTSAGGFVDFLKISPTRETRLCSADRVMVLMPKFREKAQTVDSEMKMQSSRHIVPAPKPQPHLEPEIPSELPSSITAELAEMEHTRRLSAETNSVAEENPLHIDS
jgi:hypothetical protein